MELKIKTKDRRMYERVTKLGKWHKHFAWKPVRIDEDQGVACYVWLKIVMRKCNIDMSASQFSFDPVYQKCEQLTQDILAGTVDESIIFMSYHARSTYNSLKSELKIKDDK